MWFNRFFIGINTGKWMVILLMILSVPIYAQDDNEPSGSPSGDGRIFAPYYSLSYIEGLAVPSAGSANWFVSTNLTNDLGFVVKPYAGHSIMGLYELRYAGPGFKRLEGREFMERSMDHLVFLQYQFPFMEMFNLKVKADYGKEYYRSGSNEVWGTALYDYDRYGGDVKLDTLFGSGKNKLKITFGQGLHIMKFPNYTDLLAELQTTGSRAETSGGQQDYNHLQSNVAVSYGAHSLTAVYDLQNYLKQKVLNSDGTYADKLQQDNVLSVSFNSALKFGLLFAPSVGYKLKTSNQNYLHYKVVGSTNPADVTFMENYYSYNQINASLNMVVKISDAHELFFTPEIVYKTYLSRQPRDSQNQLITGEKQFNQFIVVTAGYSVRWNPVSRWYLYYTYYDQQSNTKFEKYLPYNYQGHLVGMRFSFTY